MVKQSIINKTDFTNFLECGAILQIASDQFKLIWGPFCSEVASFDTMSEVRTAIYKPDFWDFTDSDQTKKTFFYGTKESIVDRASVLELLSQVEAEALNVQWGLVSESEFKQQYQWSQAQFAANQLTKTVPIIRQSGQVQFSLKNLAQSIRSILSEKHYGTTFGFWQNGGGFFGHTPELILNWSQDDQKLKTMALAGTMVREKENSLKILSDAKILAEHQIVVNDLVNVLSEVNSERKIKVELLEVLELKYLCHLKTEISVGDVNFQQAQNNLFQIHPTAALGLFPRSKAAYDYFKKYPIQENRKNFAAPFSFINKNSIKAIAAIRVLFFSKTEVIIYSGCGVTAESNLNDEIIELENKRNSVKKMMGLNL
ncbi:MAG: chorismate-binding protein [Pseudobdellovibrio sp.]